MRKITLVILIIFPVMMLEGCEFLGNTFKYKDITQEFVTSLLNRDYDRCVSDFKNKSLRSPDADLLKQKLEDFRQRVVRDFGTTDLKYSLIKIEKKISVDGKNDTLPNSTVAYIECSNKKVVGAFEVLFDDSSMKILSIRTAGIKKPVPSMTLFWMFGLLSVCVPVFNIYVIIRIRRSSLTKKWLKYIAVIMLNVPSFMYLATEGVTFALLNFQFLFGASFFYGGYLTSYWAFGAPLGGIYYLLKLKRKGSLQESGEIELQNSSSE